MATSSVPSPSLSPTAAIDVPKKSFSKVPVSVPFDASTVPDTGPSTTCACPRADVGHPTT
jgi:hypothetical protein